MREKRKPPSFDQSEAKNLDFPLQEVSDYLTRESEQYAEYVKSLTSKLLSNCDESQKSTVHGIACGVLLMRLSIAQLADYRDLR